MSDECIATLTCEKCGHVVRNGDAHLLATCWCGGRFWPRAEDVGDGLIRVFWRPQDARDHCPHLRERVDPQTGMIAYRCDLKPDRPAERRWSPPSGCLRGTMGGCRVLLDGERIVLDEGAGPRG